MIKSPHEAYVFIGGLQCLEAFLEIAQIKIVLPKVARGVRGVVAIVLGTLGLERKLLPDFHPFNLLLANAVYLGQVPLGEHAGVMGGIGCNSTGVGILGIEQLTGKRVCPG